MADIPRRRLDQRKARRSQISLPRPKCAGAPGYTPPPATRIHSQASASCPSSAGPAATSVIIGVLSVGVPIVTSFLTNSGTIYFYVLPIFGFHQRACGPSRGGLVIGGSSASCSTSSADLRALLRVEFSSARRRGDSFAGRDRQAEEARRPPGRRFAAPTTPRLSKPRSAVLPAPTRSDCRAS